LAQAALAVQKICAATPFASRDAQASKAALRMAHLLHDCSEVYKVYSEVDHVAQLAVQGWDKRNGGRSTRKPEMQPQEIRIRVGSDPMFKPLLREGPSRGSGAATPRSSGATSNSLEPPPSPRIIRSPVVRGVTQGMGVLRPSRGQPQEEEFVVPDFILLESSTLAELYWEGGGGQKELGPIRRSAALFQVVLTFLKLRWLVRLHLAMVSFAGRRCSLLRMLQGCLADTCEVHTHPHPPAQLYELLMETLRTRLMQRWPLFLAYVAMDDSRMPPLSSTPRRPNSRDARATAAELWQLVDDIFLAYLVQLDAAVMPASQVLQELAFYGLPLPSVPNSFDGLQDWHLVKDLPSCQSKHLRQAQREAHRFVALLESPVLRREWQLDSDEIMELARTISTHPRTFNAGLRARLIWILKGGTPHQGEPDYSAADEVDEDQYARFFTFSDGARDIGRVGPGKFAAWRSSKTPIFVGN